MDTRLRCRTADIGRDVLLLIGKGAVGVFPLSFNFTTMNKQSLPRDQRSESRVSISSIILPFLGSRTDDFTPFQYILRDLSLHGAKVLIPRWLSRRDRLRINDEVNFHAPFRFAGATYITGRIVWDRWETEFDAQACGVTFATKMPAIYPVAISFEEQQVDIDLTEFNTSKGLLLLVLKDAILLKRGIRIYLKHLAPFLSRISGIEKEPFIILRSFLFDDAESRVQQNQQYLEKVFNFLSEASIIKTDILSLLNIEELLDAFEPEIPADVFSLAFEDASVLPYLHSIKSLEEKLYTNYNTIMMLYMHSFQDS